MVHSRMRSTDPYREASTTAPRPPSVPAATVGPASGVTSVQRGQGRLGGEHPGEVVGHRHPRSHRWPVRLAGQVEQAPVGHAQPVEPGSAGVRAVLAEGADAHEHQPGVERVGAEAPFLHGPGPEVLAHDVGGRRQPAEEVLALGRAQVAGDALAAASLDGPEQRVPVDEGPDAAHEVTGAGLLHLDDLGTPFAEQPRAERRADPGADVDHPQAVEGARHAGASVLPGGSIGASPRSRAAKTSFMEPICLRCSSADSAVAVLWAHWCAMKW